MGDEIVSIEQAASEAGIPVHLLVSFMHRSGALILEPGSEDPACLLVSGLELHGQDCSCRFLPMHPDLSQIGD